MENRYSDLKLAKKKVANGQHRQFIGGMWDEIGRLQFEYLKDKGLASHHKLLDVGCGSFRGGVNFIPYLESLHYYGFDLNMPLIKAGLDVEIARLGLSEKVDIRNFSASKGFKYPPHWPEMDMAIAVSLLTHLNYSSVCECLRNTGRILKKGGQLYATIFEAPEGKSGGPFEQAAGIISQPSEDPYHYTRAKIEQAAQSSGLILVDIEDFGHPRNQKMAIFERT